MKARVMRALVWVLLLQLALPVRPVSALPTDSSTLQGSRGVTSLAGPAAASVGTDAFRGAATYAIPIAVPPGTGGMQPQLTLAYSSQNRGDSWVGVGWSIGLPSISRSLERGVPAYDDDIDVFLFDGEELVPESSDPDLPRAYRTRHESFSRIVHESDDSWTVTGKGGTRMRFGTTSESVVANDGDVPFQWLLSEQEDLHGNALVVGYDDTDPGVAYPDEIRYTLRRNGASLQSLGNDPGRDRVVDFVLEPRPDVSTSYRAGFPARLGHRLSHIEISVSGALLRRYDLIHETSPDSFRSLVAGVALYGTDADATPPTPPLFTSFTYTSNSDAPQSTGWALASAKDFSWGPPFSLVASDNRDTGVRIADMNGDGLPDLIKALSRVDASNQHTLTIDSGVYLNDGTGFSSTAHAGFSTPWPTFTAAGGGQVPLAFAWDYTALGVVWGNGMNALDLTGDGRADLIGAVGVPLGATTDPLLQVFQGPWCRSTGAEFQCTANPGDLYADDTFFTAKQGFHWTNPNNSVLGPLAFAFFDGNTRFGDLNGDALPDLLVRGDDYRAFGTPAQCDNHAIYSYTAYNRGDLDFEQAVIRQAALPEDCAVMSEVISHDYQPCDLAAPGCREKLHFSTSQMLILFSPVFHTHLVLGNAILDLNADGLDDAVSATNLKGSPVEWAGLNDGDGAYLDDPLWQLPTLVTRVDPEVPLSGWPGETDGKSMDLGVRFADVNGDGRLDVVQAQAGGGRATWLNDGNTSGRPWVTSTDWQLPAGLDFVNAAGQDLGVRLLDVNGDGMTDVLSSRAGSNQVYLNEGSVSDLLETVTTPLGGITSIGYAPSTEFVHLGGDTIPDLPQILPLVVAVETDDLRGNVATTTIGYQDGRFDADDREFRGFGTVVQTRADGRETTTHYHQDVARAGLVESLEVRDSEGALWAGAEYEYTEDDDGPPYVTLPESELRLEYDGQAAPRRTFTVFQYDGGGAITLGNRTATIQYGEVTVAGADVNVDDTRTHELAYTLPNLAAHLTDRVAIERVRAGSTPGTGAIVQETQFFYDHDTTGAVAPTKGDLTLRVDKLHDVQNPDPITGYDYDDYGNLVEITNPRWNASGGAAGARTTIEYDTVHHTFPTARISSLVPHRVELAYTTPAECDVMQPAGVGLVHQERNPNDLVAGTSTLRCYDVFGRIVLDRGPNGLAETTWAYDDTPGAAAVTESRLASDAGGQLVTTTYLDGAGRVVGTASSGPQNQTALTATTYDLVGRLWTQTAPHFQGAAAPPPTLLAYDPLDRLVHTTRPGARIETTDYDRGLVTSTDANQNVKERVVDPFGNVIEVREVTSGGTFVTGYEFDLLDRLTKVTDQHQNETIIGYDLLGRRRLLDDPDTGITTFSYDSNGNLSKRIGPLGSVEWTYDALDRPRTQRLNGSFSDDVTWHYDTATGGIGQLAVRTDRVGTYQALVYDGLGRVFQERWTAGSSHHAFATLYDPLGQVISRTYPSGRVVDWVRDGRGFLTAIEADDGASQYASGITWDAEGRPTAWAAGNGVDTTVGFDPTTSRLDSIQVQGATLLERLSYQYDEGDRVRIVVDHRNQLRNQGFEYDALDRLVEATGPYGFDRAPETRYYFYDEIGNLTCRDSTSPPDACENGTELIYPPPGSPRPHAPVTVNGAAVGFDPGGNLETLGSRAYAYGVLGQLGSIRDGGTLLVDFAYDGSGRLGRITEYPGGARTRFVLAPDFEWKKQEKLGRIHVHLAGQLLATHEFTYDPPGSCGLGFEIALLLPLLSALAAARRSRRGRRAALATGTAGVFLVVTSVPWGLGGPRGGGAWAASPAGVLYYHGNHLGSSTLVTATTGTVVQRAVYRPFGGIVPPAGGASEPPEFGFTGQRSIAGTGVYDYGARFYDPALGRFLQPDSLVPEPTDPQSLNRYSYVRNSPTNRIDPSGNFDFGNLWQGVTGFFGGVARSFAGVGSFFGDRLVNPFAERIGNPFVERFASPFYESVLAPVFRAPSRLANLFTNPGLGSGQRGQSSVSASSAETSSQGQDRVGLAAWSEGRSTAILYSDYTEEVRSGGTWAWRNNNPGNIEATTLFAWKHGAIGSSGPGGRFAVFPNEATGTAALDSLLRTSRYQSLTLDGVMEVYAPSNENPTAEYQQFLRNQTGLPGHTPLSGLSSQQLGTVAGAIRQFEGWRPGSILLRRMP